MARQPAYSRIREDLAQMIESGDVEPGSPLPSETALAERYGVTRMTVRQAVYDLVRDGLVARQHGRGTFVLPARSRYRRLRRLTSFQEDMREQGCEVSTHMLAQEDLLAPPDIARELALGDGAHVVYLGRVRLVDGTPIAVQHSWVPLGLCPSLAREPLVKGSLYTTLEERCGVLPRRAEQRITAASATREQARLLRLNAHAALIYGERRTYDSNNTPIEFARSWTNPEYPISIELER